MATWCSHPATPAAAWSEALARLGFVPVAEGWQREGFSLTTDLLWLKLTTPVQPADPDRLDTPGQPGLWKRVLTARGARRLFALPASLVLTQTTEAELDDSAGAPGEQAVRWALDTARGVVASSWQAPAQTEVESWFKPEDLTVVSGELLCQGELVCQPEHLALRFGLTPPLTDDLPRSRREWLRVLFEEAQNRSPLVRIGFLPGESGEEAVAEVDLTGAPSPLIESLFVASLETLRWVVQGLGEPADWLADVSVASELLAVCPNAESQQRSQTNETPDPNAGEA
jgi:hypothetical protein